MRTRQRKPGKKPVVDLPGSIFGYVFQDPSLLASALTHRSQAYETGPETLLDPASDNEQLEFLGDAVLGLVVAESLTRRFPASREGELTRLRASLVSRKHMGDVAARLDLGRMLRLGRGEERSGGRHKPAILANAMEAVIAALYLDGGFKAAARFIEAEVIEPLLPDLNLALCERHTFSGAIGDHKSALQEFLQAAGAGQPQYVLIDESGPDHLKCFRVEVRTGEATLANAQGATKKMAQQEAARIAFERLRADSSLLPKAAALDGRQ